MRRSNFHGSEPVLSAQESAAGAMQIEPSAELIQAAPATFPPAKEKGQSGSIDAFNELTLQTRDGPSFLNHSMGAKSKRSLKMRWSRRSPDMERFNSIRSTIDRLVSVWRGHLRAAEASSRLPQSDRSGVAQGIIVTGLCLLVIIVGLGGLLAIGQIHSLKAQIKQMERAFSPLKAQIARLDRVENAEEEEAKEARTPPPVKSAPSHDPAAPPKLELSQDEIRLIKEYIKPAPGGRQASGQSINIGDAVGVGTVSLPSPVTDKIPKLLGARFTIRNGAIIILNRGSRQADAILPTNQ